MKRNRFFVERVLFGLFLFRRQLVHDLTQRVKLKIGIQLLELFNRFARTHIFSKFFERFTDVIIANRFVVEQALFLKGLEHIVGNEVAQQVNICQRVVVSPGTIGLHRAAERINTAHLS